jgi:hypothetical protein
MRRFNCLLMENSAGANSNFTTPFACADYSEVGTNIVTQKQLGIIGSVLFAS